MKLNVLRVKLVSKGSKWENISVDELGGLYQVAIRKGSDWGLQTLMHMFSRHISLRPGRREKFVLGET